MSDRIGAAKKNDKKGVSKASLLFFAITAVLCVIAAVLIGANGESETESSAETVKTEMLSAQRFVEAAKNAVSFTDAGSDAESNTYVCERGEFECVLMLSLRFGEVRSFTVSFQTDAEVLSEGEESAKVLDMLDEYSLRDDGGNARFTSDMRAVVETFISAMDESRVLLRSDREMLSGLVIETMEDAKNRDASIDCYDFSTYTQDGKLLAVMKYNPEGKD